MAVFISHGRKDTNEAMYLKKHLHQSGIESTLIAFDPTIHPTAEIARSITDTIKRYTHIISVVSGYSTSSWWVPFKYGIGTERDRRISTYKVGHEVLPGFFDEWPILKSQKDIGHFVRHYKQDSSVYTLPDTASRDLPRKQKPLTIHSACDFHSQLKLAIGGRE